MREMGIYSEYEATLSKLKVEMKAHLMMDTADRRLCREFRTMFRAEEASVGTAFLRRGERLMLWTVRRRLFLLGDALRHAVLLRNSLRRTFS